MAKTGQAVAKLAAKSKQRAVRLKLGTHNAVVSRTRSSFHEKRVAFDAHRRLITEHYINLGPRVTYIKKSGDDTATTFRGDGLPDEVTRKVKTNAERAAEDKRQSIKSEVREGWKPERYTTKWMRARGL